MFNCLKSPSTSNQSDEINQDSQVLECDHGKTIPRNGLCKTSKKKFIIGSILIFLAISISVILAVVLTRSETTNVDEYQETQYTLKVKTTMTSHAKDEASTTHDELDMTIFALDMKGEKYTLMILNGAFNDKPQESNLGEAPPTLFMSFDVSKSGEILESRYFKANFTDEITTLLSGIVQAFVVDQDSEFDVESECKKTKKGSTQCTRNSKHKQEHKTMFQKKGKNEEFGDDEDEKLEHTSQTWVGEHGKLEKTEIKGKYQKKFKNQDGEGQMDFDLKAEVIIVSAEKLTSVQVNELKEIDSKLPEVNEKSEYKTKTLINEVKYDETSDEEEPDLPPYLSTNLNQSRELSQSDDQGRSLFDNSFSYLYFSTFEIPFHINSRMYSGYDNTYKFWTCGVHRFKFSTLEMMLLKTDFCISSNKVIPGLKFTVPAWSQSLTLKAYLTQVKFSIFSVLLYSTVTVKSLPTVQTYLNTFGNVVTKMNIAAAITVSISGQSTNGVSKGGVTLNSLMKSNVNDYMVGYNSPFYAYMFVDKSFQADYQIWVQSLTITKTCYNILTVNMCFPDVKYSTIAYLVKQTVAYQYYPEQLLFSAVF